MNRLLTFLLVLLLFLIPAVTHFFDIVLLADLSSEAICQIAALASCFAAGQPRKRRSGMMGAAGLGILAHQEETLPDWRRTAGCRGAGRRAELAS